MRNALLGAAAGNGLKKPGLETLALAALPALAVVATGVNGLVVGAGALLTMAGTSLLLSAVWRFIRQELRGFACVLFAATVASMAQMIASVALPRVASSLGLYLPLVSIACALTAFWEVSDEDREPEDSLVRAVGNGAMYLLTLTILGSIREVLGSGAIFGISLGDAFQPMRMLASAPGGFLLAGVTYAIIRALLPKRLKGGEDA